MKKTNCLLSIIVPVYNVEKYILECAESIFKQWDDTYGIEVIFINDGSTDNSLSILEKYLKDLSLNVSSLKVISQFNKGLSGARNTGIEMSTGKYLYFLDSDDKICGNFFKEVCPILNKEHIDIMEFNAFFFYQDKDRIIKKLKKNIYNSGFKIIQSDYERVKFFASQDWAVWYRIFNANIFTELRFPEGYLYEDVMTVPFIYNQHTRIYSLDKALIMYRYNPNSIMNKRNTKALDSINYALTLFQNNLNSDYLNIIYNRFQISSIVVLLKNYNINFVLKWVYRNFQRLEKNHLNMTTSKKLKFANKFPYLTVVLLVIRRKLNKL